jgi:hypothetical protein
MKTRTTSSMLIALLLVSLTFGIPAVATAHGFDVNVTGVSYSQGTGFVNIGVAVPKGIDTAARSGNANRDLHLILTYVDRNGAVRRLDSGDLSIKNNTVRIRSIDNHTDLIQLRLPFGALTLPSNIPSFSTSAQIPHLRSQFADLRARWWAYW